MWNLRTFLVRLLGDVDVDVDVDSAEDNQDTGDPTLEGGSCLAGVTGEGAQGVERSSTVRL